MLIYKEQLPEDTMDVRLLELPFSTVEAARKAVLKIDMQYGTPCMWYQADAEEQCLISGEKNSFLVMAIGTGHDWGMICHVMVILERHYCMTVHWYCIIFCWKSRTRKRQRLKNRKRNGKKILADKILKGCKNTRQDQGGISE